MKMQENARISLLNERPLPARVTFILTVMYADIKYMASQEVFFSIVPHILTLWHTSFRKT